MTAFFQRLIDHCPDDYWSHERECVERVVDFLDQAGVQRPPRIVCYVRRQDRFLESVYGQFVKQTPGYQDDLPTFMQEAGPVDDYAGHLDCWARAVGREQVVVRRYDDAAPCLVQDFLEAALDVRDSSDIRLPARPVNESLGPQALAFKRVLNRLEPSVAKGYVISRVVTRLARKMDDDPDISLMAPVQRRALLERNARGNARIATEYLHCSSGQLFAPPEERAVVSAGLEPARGIELLRRYRHEMARPSIRAEIAVRGVVSRLLQQWPVLERFSMAVRHLVNRRRLRLEREGRV